MSFFKKKEKKTKKGDEEEDAEEIEGLADNIAGLKLKEEKDLSLEAFDRSVTLGKQKFASISLNYKANSLNFFLYLFLKNDIIDK